jgi:GNAT superfamily N-acetyltransferase
VTTLLDVEHRSLGDSNYTPAEALEIVAQPNQRIYLAEREGVAVGFCACIETPSPAGTRLEVDMLGVLPEARGQGLGSALIRHSLEQARQRGIRRFRAVVATDNVASLRAFERAGFVTQYPEVAMLVYVLRGLCPVPFVPEGWRWQLLRGGDAADPWRAPVAAPAQGASAERHVVYDAQGMERGSVESLVVQTLAYQGIWVESLDYQNETSLRLMGRALAERAKVLDVDEVGYLAPQDSHAPRRDAALRRMGFEEVGRYLVMALDDAP